MEHSILGYCRKRIGATKVRLKTGASLFILACLVQIGESLRSYCQVYFFGLSSTKNTFLDINQLMDMHDLSKDVWVVGFGRFGKLALQRLRKIKADSTFLVVDTVSTEREAALDNVQFINQDGVSFLKRQLEEGRSPNWIVPAVPIHLAAEWCLRSLGQSRVQRIAAPDGIEAYVPSLMQGDSGDAYVSLATFQCPDDCPEPADYCTATREKRERNLFDVLREMQIPGYKVLVLRSHQLAPGVGGYKGKDLLQLRSFLTDSQGRFLLATACRCHGVITAIESYAESSYRDHSGYPRPDGME